MNQNSCHFFRAWFRNMSQSQPRLNNRTPPQGNKHWFCIWLTKSIKQVPLIKNWQTGTLRWSRNKDWIEYLLLKNEVTGRHIRRINSIIWNPNRVFFLRLWLMACYGRSARNRMIVQQLSKNNKVNWRPYWKDETTCWSNWPRKLYSWNKIMLDPAFILRSVKPLTKIYLKSKSSFTRVFL